MTSTVRKSLRRLAWFMAGLLCAVLCAIALPSVWQPATATQDIGYAAMLEANPQPRSVISSRNPEFEAMAASHLEPNFYQ